MMEKRREPSGYLHLDLAEVGKTIEENYRNAGEAIELASRAPVVGDGVPAISVAIDYLLDTVKALSEMLGLIAFEAAGEVELARTELAAVQDGAPDQPHFSSRFHPGGGFFAPFDGHTH